MQPLSETSGAHAVSTLPLATANERELDRDARRASATGDAPPAEDSVEVSVVIPCLDEADTIGACVRRALDTMRRHGIAGEVVVADNGSTDGSDDIARLAGARVVPVADRGYGAAIMGGVQASRGRFVIMGDGDLSYDFGEIPAFVARLREGAELVQGCRLARGGGTILPGAMPPLHRWLGNPLFTALARWWFLAPIHDVYCGMRGFTRELYDRLDQRCMGMEFATEMVIRASLQGARMAEVPILLHPDGRQSRAPHLRTWRDGWRTLRFFLMYSPRWLFLVPGALLMLAGIVGYALALPGARIGPVEVGLHTLLFASLFLLTGYQSILFAIFTKTFAIAEGLQPHSMRMARLERVVTLERGLLVGTVAIAIGLVLLAVAVNDWREVGFGHLEYGPTMRVTIPGVTLTALGVQTILSSFFLSILRLRRR